MNDNTLKELPEDLTKYIDEICLLQTTLFNAKEIITAIVRVAYNIGQQKIINERLKELGA